MDAETRTRSSRHATSLHHRLTIALVPTSVTSREGPDAQLVIVRTGEGVDDTTWISAQVPALRRRGWDRSEEPAVGKHRAEGMQPRTAVPPNRRQIADGKDMRAGRNGLISVESRDPGPESLRHRGDLWSLSREV